MFPGPGRCWLLRFRAWLRRNRPVVPLTLSDEVRVGRAAVTALVSMYQTEAARIARSSAVQFALTLDTQRTERQG